jgi:predicted GNAT family acetyltransferase
MKAEVLVDPARLLERASDLLADEARHNLILGIVRTLIDSPGVFAEFRLYLVSEGDRPLAAAVVTPPFKVAISDATEAQALAPLAALIAADAEVPGAVGNRPTIDRFVAEWQSHTGRAPSLEMAQGVFELRQVQPVPVPSGIARAGVPSDQEIIEEWIEDFAAEALPHEDHDRERMRAAIARRLSGADHRAYWLWVRDGEPVSLSGHGSTTGNGIRIGPVYTPPALRGRGYATALVAAESRWLLEDGYRFCFLYTDLANPTSNAIYRRIGYQQIAESAMRGFGDAK